ncbi:hypothetical protein quinque_009313 [Culex quinquefasciatus]
MKTLAIELVATLAIAAIAEPGPAVEYTYPIKPPVGACPQNLLVSCNEHYESVPCEGGHGQGAHQESYDGPGYYQPPPPPPPGYGVGPQYGDGEDGDYEDDEYGVNSEKSRAMGGRNKWMKKFYKLKSKRGKHRGHRRREGSELEDMSMEDEEM